MEKIRIDKWLWAVRVFKTRSLASEECNKGHVSVGDVKVKPSREIKVGEIVKVKLSPIERSLKVIGLADKRMSAPLVKDFMEDVTPPEMFDLLHAARAFGFERRDKGIGRPTKRDRRMIDKLKEGTSDEE